MHIFAIQVQFVIEKDFITIQQISVKRSKLQIQVCFMLGIPVF